MTKIIILLSSFMVFCSGCGVLFGNISRYEKAQQSWDTAGVESQQNIQSLRHIQSNMLGRGYLSLDEMVEAFKIKQGSKITGPRPTPGVADVLIDRYPGSNISHSEPYQEACELFASAIEKDYLPFKAMLYLALEKEKYEEAELIRRNWVNFLHNLSTFFKSCGSTSAWITEKITIQVENLKIVGLTDQMLVVLRKELVLALKEKKWDDAQKIQNLIATRANELKPPQPQVVQTASGQTTIIVPQESSTRHVQIEHIPRYGASDVGRAVSLITRGSSALTPKEAGTLGLLDILMKR
jgi:hypothetical protein